MSEKSNAVAMKLCDTLLSRPELERFSLGLKRQGHLNRINVMGPLFDLKAHVEVDMQGWLGVRGMDDGLFEEKIFRTPEEALDHILLCCR